VAEELTDQQLKERVEALHALDRSLREALSDTSRADTVDLDLPIGRLSRMDAMQQQAMAKAERELQKRRLVMVEAALERVDEEEYGWCCSCGESVGYPRLKARPESPFCVPCQEGLEQ